MKSFAAILSSEKMASLSSLESSASDWLQIEMEITWVRWSDGSELGHNDGF